MITETLANLPIILFGLLVAIPGFVGIVFCISSLFPLKGDRAAVKAAPARTPARAAPAAVAAQAAH